jgi:hypothetical protein
LWAILDEAVLRRTVAGTAVQIVQLRHLIRLLKKQSNLTLQVVPYGAMVYPVPDSFSVLRFAESYLSDVVYVENLTSALYIDKRTETDHYLLALERMAGAASTPDQTIQILEQVIQDLDG